MIIKTLIENESISPNLKTEHGLSFYIETKKHKLLFDCGAGPGFIDNARQMNVDLTKVDLVVLSHGHSDHGGGLSAFLELNPAAKVYIQSEALTRHYARRKDGELFYIGLDQDLAGSGRLVFCGDNFVIDEELELFSGIKGDRFVPSGNRDLLMEKDGLIVADDFCHEQNLIIKEDGKFLLLTGCAHRGIVNIIETFRIKKGYLPDDIIGGFHLYIQPADRKNDLEVVDAVGQFLLETNARYYTCHCTGLESYQILKGRMGDRIQYLATGSTITI